MICFAKNDSHKDGSIAATEDDDDHDDEPIVLSSKRPLLSMNTNHQVGAVYQEAEKNRQGTRFPSH